MPSDAVTPISPPLPPDDRHQEIASLWKQIEQSPLAADPTNDQPAATPQVSKGYYPLVDTFRLYAGWLLAWYFLIYALGSYQWLRHLPFQIPFLGDLFQSTLILDFACACFLFLLLTSLHRRMGRGWVLGILLTLVGFGLFAGFYANT